jgi:hypothetical protein
MIMELFKVEFSFKLQSGPLYGKVGTAHYLVKNLEALKDYLAEKYKLDRNTLSNEFSRLRCQQINFKEI